MSESAPNWDFCPVFAARAVYRQRELLTGEARLYEMRARK
jgi:hypothetical protein